MYQEIWKDIPGYEGIYQASNFGRIRSLDRVVLNRNIKNHVKGRVRVASPDQDGYLGLTLSKNGIHKSFHVHRLVAITFIPNPENKLEVNHIDLNKQNNRVDNLEWCTRLENERHSRNNSNKDLMTNKRCKPIKCIETGKMFRSVSAASKALGISTWFIEKSISNRSKSNGFHFKCVSHSEFNSYVS